MNEVYERCENFLKEGRSIEVVLTLLRKSGYTRVESIKAIMRLMDRGLAEAKKTVHLSQTWSDLRDQTDVFHDLLADSSTEEGKQK